MAAGVATALTLEWAGNSTGVLLRKGGFGRRRVAAAGAVEWGRGCGAPAGRPPGTCGAGCRPSGRVCQVLTRPGSRACESPEEVGWPSGRGLGRLASRGGLRVRLWVRDQGRLGADL